MSGAVEQEHDLEHEFSSNERSAGVLAWLRLVRVFQKVDRAASEHLRCWHLSPAQLDVLARVDSDPGISQQRLADALLVTKGNICQLLDKMERNLLIQRRPEGRINRLFLTDKGRALYEQVMAPHDQVIGNLLNALPRHEQRTLLRLLRQLDHGLRR